METCETCGGRGVVEWDDGFLVEACPGCEAGRRAEPLVAADAMKEADKFEG
jgi:DnaJ-class molecular chaperone